MQRAAAIGLLLVVGHTGSAGAPQLASTTFYPRLARILTIEDRRAPSDPELRLLLATARSSANGSEEQFLRLSAIRALGRLARSESVPVLTDLTGHVDAQVRSEAATALAFILRSGTLSADDPTFTAVVDRLLGMAGAPPAVLGNLPYQKPGDVRAAEVLLRAGFEKLANPPAEPIRAVEALARRHRKLSPLTPDTLDVLKRIAMRLVRSDQPAPRRNAMAALLAAGVVDDEIIESALGDADPEVRRLSALALVAGGTTVDPAARTELTRLALRDQSAIVRYEGVRAWARHEATANGCGPLLDALGDESMHVVLSATDALGERCLDDGDITDRLTSESRTPPTIGSWHREAHALVSLARRSPERASMSLPAFALHQVWQVRMYAARAAALLKDPTTLERLAYDREPNVREAALPALRVLKGDDSEAAFISALAERDYQLLRTAAASLKGAASTRQLRTALVEALQRVTAEKKDTSRDTRLALLERIGELGSADLATTLDSLARDFDPVVAEAASAAHATLTGSPLTVESVVLPRPPAPTERELRDTLSVRVALDNGRTFEIALLSTRPLGITRFRRLARGRYYNGLTFHRVVPNFVVQGGSPGANEFEGDGPFMRDELTPDGHERGTVGISTRGRDTGDAQIFINLVDNPRLDFEYTIIGRVPGSQMPVVDSMQEGTRISSITFVPSSR